MFWLMIKKCTTGKLIKNSRTPEIKDMEMSLKNTDWDKKGAAEGFQAREKRGWVSFWNALSVKS